MRVPLLRLLHVQIPRDAAIFNISRTALLVNAMQTGDFDALRTGAPPSRWWSELHGGDTFACVRTCVLAYVYAYVCVRVVFHARTIS